MADIETIPANTRYFTEVAAPSTPSSGEGVLYAATDGTLHYLNDGATDTELGSGGGGDITSDGAWVAAGDLIVADGENSAAILTKGSDDQVLTMVSGSVAWAAAAGGGGGIVAFDAHKETGGSFTLNSTSWANVNTGTDLVVAASSGDLLHVELSGVWGAEVVDGYLNAATIVSASPVNYIGSTGAGTEQGVGAWRGHGLSSYNASAGGGVHYVVQAGDISGGNVTLRLRYRTSTASNKTLFAIGNIPLQWSVVNLGQ